MSTRKRPAAPGEPRIQSLPLASLRRDGGTQPRAGLSENTVTEYAEAMAAGATFPPVTVFFDGTDYWLADGFHRAAAAERPGSSAYLKAEVRPGGPRDARLWAAGANATHGLRRTNADKRRAVALLLGDEEWSRWSDRQVARRCGVSPTFVGNLRDELSVHGGQMDGARRLVERGGAVYEMETAGIGLGPPLSAEETQRLHEHEATIERAIERARQSIAAAVALGVTFTPTGATFPPNMPRETWERIGPLLADLHVLANLHLSSDSDSWPLGLIVLDPELRDLLPACTPEEDAELAEDILAMGVLQPLVIWRETRILVDGYRRLAVISLHGLPYRVVMEDFEDRNEAIAYRLRMQLLRKSMSAGERAEVLAKVGEWKDKYG